MEEPRPAATPPESAPHVVITLPKGMIVSGITTWAVRLARGLATRGRRVLLAAHTEPRGFTPIPAEGVEVVRIRGEGADTARDLPAYRELVQQLLTDSAGAGGRRIVFLPSLAAGSYATVARLRQEFPGVIRVVGWQHNHIPYDLRMLEYFAPTIDRFVAVSTAIARRQRIRLASRSDDISLVPYGVEVPPSPAVRPPLAGRPIRLIYTGRMDHTQKRIGAVLAMSEELQRRRLAHELTLVGDGPASDEVDQWCSARPHARRCSPSGPRQVADMLREHDCFVLASRYEGLSVAMLEAMAQGCTPVVTRVASGAEDAVEAGVCGELVAADEFEADDSVGRNMAEGVASVLARGADAMGAAAWRRAKERFSIESHFRAAERVIDAAARAGERYGSHREADGMTVPPDAGERAEEVLRELRGRRIALWGAGRHTNEIVETVRQSGAMIAAVLDDDPARWGERVQDGEGCGWPIVDPHRAIELGITDVVISSWLHEEAMWARREIFERVGIAVHRLYGGRTACLLP